MNPDALKTTILDLTGQRLPAQFGAVEIGCSVAELDVSSVSKNSEWLVIERIMPTIKNILVASVCPGIVHCPSFALDNVKHVYKDTNGNQVTMSVYYYFVNCYSATGVNGINAFEKDALYHMVINIEPSIKSELMPMTINNLGPHSLDACAYIKALGKLLTDATAAELCVLNIVNMVEQRQVPSC